MSRRLHPAALAGSLGCGLVALTVLVTAALLGATGQAADLGCTAPSAPDAAPPTAAAVAQIPARLIAIYQQAAAGYGLGGPGWAWLAAVNRVETDFGRDLATSPTGAIGWMQFEPATWAAFGVDGDGDGRKDPYAPADAIPAAARYLAALGAPSDWQTAIRAYNGGPANARAPVTLAYWRSVSGDAIAYLAGSAAPAPAPTDGCQPCVPPDPAAPPDPLVAGEPAVATDALPPSACADGGAVPLAPGDRAQIQTDGRAVPPDTAPPAVRAMIAAGNQLIGKPYVYGGGHADWTPAAGYDCSSSVSWALHGAGLLVLPEDSTTLEGFGDPGAGLWVTVFANPDHAFVELAGIRLDTSPQPGDGRLRQLGPRWRPATRSTAGFVARHPAGL